MEYRDATKIADKRVVQIFERKDEPLLLHQEVRALVLVYRHIDKMADYEIPV